MVFIFLCVGMFCLAWFNPNQTDLMEDGAISEVEPILATVIHGSDRTSYIPKGWRDVRTKGGHSHAASTISEELDSASKNEYWTTGGTSLGYPVTPIRLYDTKDWPNLVETQDGDPKQFRLAGSEIDAGPTTIHLSGGSSLGEPVTMIEFYPDGSEAENIQISAHDQDAAPQNIYQNEP